jgi:hypothetical protein
MGMADVDHRAPGVERSTYEPLLQLATPRLYADNPFRVLGVRVDATPRDVQREQRRRHMQDKLGLAAGETEKAPAFRPHIDPEAQRGAVEALTRPVERLFAELFWFWPMGEQDEALAALAAGDASAAEAVWESAPSELAPIARHNMAVLHHARCLESQLASDSELASTHDVPESLRRWAIVAQDEDFWSIFAARAEALDDRRVTPELVQQIRGSLPEALLSVHGRVAHAEEAAGRPEEAATHIANVVRSPFGRDLASRVLLRLAKPSRKRVQAAIEDATRAWTESPHKADVAVRDLYERCRPRLEELERLSLDEDPTLKALHDDVAAALLSGAVEYGEATENWGTCVELHRLALKIVRGEGRRAAINRNFEIVKRNVEGHNRWCAPGYWEQPEEILSELEAARTRLRAGDFQGAVEALLDLHPAIGAPVVRALAKSLNGRGYQLRQAAWDAFEADGSNLRRLIARLSDGGAALTLLGSRPDPNNPAHLNPPCPTGCGRSYSSWVNFTLKSVPDVPLFMCAACSAEDDREVEVARVPLRAGLTDALAYARLAAEMEPDNSEMKSDLDFLKKEAEKAGCVLPPTEQLRARLRGSRQRKARADAQLVPSDAPCHFCGTERWRPDESITVTMYGDVRSAPFVLGEGIEYRWDEVIVPRCERCHSEHAGLLERTRERRLALEAATQDDQFPELQAAVAAAAAAAEAANGEVARLGQALSRARVALEATREPVKCDRCGSRTDWDEGLCRACDAALYSVGAGPAWLIAGIGIAALGNLFLGAGAPMLETYAELLASSGQLMVDATALVGLGAAGGVAALVAALTGGVSRRRRIERAETRVARREAFETEHAAAAKEAAEAVKRTEAQLSGAETDAALRADDLSQARARLETARALAREQFEASHPEPALPAGVAPEASYRVFERIASRRAAGWMLGVGPSEVAEEADAGRGGVVGLVSA